jgi:hypothetical protein
MGYLRHECLIVSSDDADAVLRVQTAACSIFDEQGMGRLVGGLTQHLTNGGAAFLISPDGSKEGWGQSNDAEAARNELIEWLRSGEAPFVNWALVLIGGDDGEYRVLQSPNDPAVVESAIPSVAVTE